MERNGRGHGGEEECLVPEKEKETRSPLGRWAASATLIRFDGLVWAD